MKTQTKRRVAGGLLAATLVGGLAGAATATAASAAPCGNEYRLTSNHTLYRTATGFTPNGSLPSRRIVFDYGRASGRMNVGSGWISPVNMVMYREGTCPA
jgi:hypothetical protein